MIISLCAAFVLIAMASLWADPVGFSNRGEVRHFPIVEPRPQKNDLSLEKQVELSSRDFITIYELSQNNKRSANLKQIIEIYYRIINRYPDAPLAEESYWHLIKIMLHDFQPARKSEAQELYNTFITNYPDSLLRNVAADTLMRFYYRNKFWNDLLEITSPYMQEFVPDAIPEAPVPIFFYSEAQFHLADLQEASRGYELIVKFFPDTLMARITRTRMVEINKIDE